MIKNPFKLRILPIALASALVAPTAAIAAEEGEEEAQKLTIVGSHIKRSDVEGPSPVQVIDRDAIDASGRTTLRQLVEQLPAAGAGTFSTRGNSQDSTGNGGAAISLRGFGADATLVLINGRRAGISPFAESVVNNFVDLNSIPLSAIEQVEILKDGASAIYGSDAVSGVVNIKLRNDFVGSEVTVGYGSTTSSSADETTLNAIFGWGDDVTNGTFIFDYFSTGELRNEDRGRIGTANQEPNGGFDFRSSRGFPGRYVVNGTITIDPDCPADRSFGATCVFDYGPYGYLIPEMERAGAMFLFTRELTTNTEMFIEFSAQRNTSEAGGAPTPLDGSAGLTVPATHPNNPFGVDIAIDRHRTVDANPRVWDVQSESFRMVTGFAGSVGDYEWEASMTKARSLSLQTGDRTQGWVRTDFLQREIDAGRYNPFGGTVNPQSVIDDIVTSLVRKGESRLTAFEGKISGDAWEMDSGSVGIAAGYEYRKESVIDVPDDQFQRGLIFGTESVSAQAERDHWSMFVEFMIPVTEQLELQVAGRYDDYEFAGTSTNPKLALRWAPSDDVAVRASWGTGFRAPSLAQIGLGPSQESRFFEDTYCNTSALCPSPGGATDYTFNFSGNPDLKPEESETLNIGVIWDVSDDLNFSVDYWDITQDNKIDEPNFLQLYQLTCDPDPASANYNPAVCERDSVTNELQELNSSYRNVGTQEANGVDISANYQMDLADMGRLKLGLDWTYLMNFEKGQTDLVTGAEDSIDWTGEYEFPQVRWNATAEWKIGEWTTTAILNYVGEFEDQPFDFANGLDVDEVTTRTVDSWLTLDMTVAYDYSDNTTLSFGAANLLDEEPPFAIGDANSDLYGYVSSQHDPRGRFLFAKATFRF